MNRDNIPLDGLAQRTQQGDLQAKVQLKQQLEPNMNRIVRHVLERGQASSSLERRILAVAERLVPQAGAQGNPARTAVVSRNLCEMVVNRLWPGATEGSWARTTTA